MVEQSRFGPLDCCDKFSAQLVDHALTELLHLIIRVEDRDIAVIDAEAGRRSVWGVENMTYARQWRRIWASGA